MWDDAFLSVLFSSLSLFVPVGGGGGGQRDGGRGLVWDDAFLSVLFPLSLSLFVPVGEGRLGRGMVGRGCSWSSVSSLCSSLSSSFRACRRRPTGQKDGVGRCSCPPSPGPLCALLSLSLFLFSCLSAKADWAEGWRRVVVHGPLFLLCPLPSLPLCSCLSAKADWAEGWRLGVVHGRLFPVSSPHSLSFPRRPSLPLFVPVGGGRLGKRMAFGGCSW